MLKNTGMEQRIVMVSLNKEYELIPTSVRVMDSRKSKYELNSKLTEKAYFIEKSTPSDFKNLVIEEVEDTVTIALSKISGIKISNRALDKEWLSLSNEYDRKLIDYNLLFGENIYLVKYPNGELQYLCKLMPTPKDLFLRRFCPIKSIVEKNDYKYEMKSTGYNKTMEVPILSGCFMFLKNEVLKTVGLFDENYFMYMEDFDFCRRIGEKYKVIYLTSDYSNSSYNTKRDKSIEVLIVNY